MVFASDLAPSAVDGNNAGDSEYADELLGRSLSNPSHCCLGFSLACLVEKREYSTIDGHTLNQSPHSTMAKHRSYIRENFLSNSLGSETILASHLPHSRL